MDFKSLQYFVGIAEAGTLTAASSELHIAQSALTRQLKALEDEFGVQLMNRGSRSLTLTDEGRILYESSKKLLDWSTSIHTELRDISSGSTGILRLGTTPNFFNAMLASVMPKFRNDFPAVKYEIYEELTDKLIIFLRDGLIDVAIVRTPIDEIDLKVHYVIPDPLVVCYRGNKYFSKNKESVTIKELENIPIFTSRPWYRLLYPLCQEQGFKLNVIALNERIQTNVFWAKNMDGCAIVPIKTLEQFGEDQLNYKLIDEPRLRFDTKIVTVENRYLPKVAENFLTYCEAAVKKR